MDKHALMHDDAMKITPESFRAQREALDLTQSEVAARSGLGLSTVQNFEREKAVSSRSVKLLVAALKSLEEEARRPKQPSVEVSDGDLRAVLDEIRAFRRLYEDDALRLRDLVERVEALEARSGAE